VREPIFHSWITDVLPEEHPGAHRSLHCVECKTMVHAFNNECMRPWFETGIGAVCLECFTKIVVDLTDTDVLALPDEPKG